MVLATRKRDRTCDYAQAAQDAKRAVLSKHKSTQKIKWRCETCKGYTVCKNRRKRDPFLHRRFASVGRRVLSAARRREVLVQVCHEFSKEFAFERGLGCVEAPHCRGEACTCWYCAEWAVMPGEQRQVLLWQHAAAASGASASWLRVVWLLARADALPQLMLP